MPAAAQDSTTDDATTATTASEKADRLIRNSSLVSIGPGVLPIPVVDLVALGGIQVYVIRELCKIYDIPFSKQRVKGILSAIAGGAAPAIALPAAISVLKFIPIVGQAAAVATLPALTAASTLAVGRIFKRHFEAGGGLDDVDVETMKQEYGEEVEKAKAESGKSGASGRKTASAAA